MTNELHKKFAVPLSKRRMKSYIIFTVYLTECTSLSQRSGTASFYLFFPVLPRGHAKMRLECPVKIGEVFKPAPGSDRQHRLVRSMQRFGGGIQPVFVQKGNKALPCHLPEPAHEVAGTEGADPGGIGDPKPLGIMDRDPCLLYTSPSPRDA